MCFVQHIILHQADPLIRDSLICNRRKKFGFRIIRIMAGCLGLSTDNFALSANLNFVFSTFLSRAFIVHQYHFKHDQVKQNHVWKYLFFNFQTRQHGVCYRIRNYLSCSV